MLTGLRRRKTFEEDVEGLEIKLTVSKIRLTASFRVVFLVTFLD